LHESNGRTGKKTASNAAASMLASNTENPEM